MTFRLTRFTTMAICTAALLLGGCGKTGSEKSGKSDSNKSGSKSASENGGKKKQAQAENVTMKDITPKGLKDVIAAKKGKAVLVDFWATWCKPCKKAFPHTVKLHKDYAAKGLIVMSVAMDNLEQRNDALEYLKSQGAEFLNYFSSDKIDPEKRFGEFEIPDESIPCYKIYKPDGTLLKTISGSDKEAEIDAAVQEALGLK